MVVPFNIRGRQTSHFPQPLGCFHRFPLRSIRRGLPPPNPSTSFRSSYIKDGCRQCQQRILDKSWPLPIPMGPRCSGPLVDIYQRREVRLSPLSSLWPFLSVLCGVRTEHRGYFFLSLSAFVVWLFRFRYAWHRRRRVSDACSQRREDQLSLFVSIRAAFYRLAMIFASGLLVYMASKIEVMPRRHSIELDSRYRYSRPCIRFGAACITHIRPSLSRSRRSSVHHGTLRVMFFLKYSVLISNRKRIGAIVHVFCFFYRSHASEVGPPFLLDPKKAVVWDFPPHRSEAAYGTVSML